MTSSITRHKERLVRRLEELTVSDTAGAQEQAIVQLDQQSVGRLNRMDALQRQQMAKEAARRRNLERIRILAAIKRMENEEFGWCAECGEKIAPKRLEVDPTAHLCLDCAK